MSNTKHNRPSAAKRLAAKARLVIHRILHGVSPTCPRCLCEFTQQARIEYTVDAMRPSLYRRVFRCDRCGAEFATGFLAVPPERAKS